jgi:hypothetical protein
MLTLPKFRVTQNLPIFQNFERYNLMKFKILEDVDVSKVEHPYFEKRINECGTVVDNVWDWIMTVYGHDNQGSNFRCNVVQYEGLENPFYEVVYTEKLHNRDIVISSTCLDIKTALDKAVDEADKLVQNNSCYGIWDDKYTLEDALNQNKDDVDISGYFQGMLKKLNC